MATFVSLENCLAIRIDLSMMGRSSHPLMTFRGVGARIGINSRGTEETP
ncbi:hypothetical protein [Microvirga soli]|nr:hypothetical protein [Microvirga soli]